MLCDQPAAVLPVGRWPVKRVCAGDEDQAGTAAIVGRGQLHLDALDLCNAPVQRAELQVGCLHFDQVGHGCSLGRSGNDASASVRNLMSAESPWRPSDQVIRLPQ